MKKYSLAQRLEGEEGEAVLGAGELGTHACYFLYGRLKEGAPRALKPGKGHEEIICVVKGRVRVAGPEGELVLEEGDAIHLTGEDTVMAEALGGTAVYAAAGGHSEGAGHHR